MIEALAENVSPKGLIPIFTKVLGDFKGTIDRVQIIEDSDETFTVRVTVVHDDKRRGPSVFSEFADSRAGAVKAMLSSLPTWKTVTAL